MKRDMDLVREILLAAEASEHGFVSGNPEISGHSRETVGYHVYLMREAGLVDAAIRAGMASPSPEAILLNLTWAGHDFLDSAREPGRWSQAKELMHKAGEGSFAVWGSVLTELVKKSVGL